MSTPGIRTAAVPPGNNAVPLVGDRFPECPTWAAGPHTAPPATDHVLEISR
ncbi:hypothetical protein ACWEQ2_24660 [Streptomyces sp. NPDC004096]|uniref:hypothetical protein n=1 Tax=unclassified Streptomyces TaxID=2593676 RepID=UPI0033B981F1